MKAIIDNKLYDTEKAEKVFSFIRKKQGAENIFRPGYVFIDKCNCVFYRTAKGAYFEADKTREEISLVGKDEVKRVIRKLSPDRYIELFGEVEEG